MPSMATQASSMSLGILNKELNDETVKDRKTEE